MNMHAKIAAPASQDFLRSLDAHQASLRNLSRSLCRSREGADILLAITLDRARREHAGFSKGSMAAWLMKMMREEYKTPSAVKPTLVEQETARSDHRVIDITPFLSGLKTPKSADLGTLPELEWIDISLLRIDQRYQREILRRGRTNVIRIASEFDWSMFATVIVSRIEGGLYAIVDGQHRTTAAACRGALRVPCQIIHATAGQQAAAFAAINGNVTQMSSLQLHAARVAAGDLEAAHLDEVCAAGGAVILKYPVPSNLIKPGQTLAVSCLAGALKAYGPDTLKTALLCLTGTNDGNVGLLRAALIRGLCQVLSQRPRLTADPAAAVRIAAEIDFERTLEDAATDAKRLRTPVSTIIVSRLSTTFGPAAQKLAA